MASKRGVKRRAKAKQCGNKVAHKDIGAALMVKKKTGHRDLMPYKCKWCQSWRLGHMPGRVLRAMET